MRQYQIDQIKEKELGLSSLESQVYPLFWRLSTVVCIGFFWPLNKIKLNNDTAIAEK